VPGAGELAASVSRPAPRAGFRRRVAFFLAIMGPGVITGIVDNDPTGIAGYSLAGAKFGYSMLWTLVLAGLSLGVVQEMVARMGATTGKGLADLIREQFGVKIALLAMTTLLIANSTTVVAEFAGVGGASEIFGISRFLTVPIAAIVIFLSVAYGTYRKIELGLLAVSLIYLSYVATGFLAHPEWPRVARGLIPGVQFNLEYLTILIALVGTTVTPWGMFYNQATVVDKGLGEREAGYVSADAYTGASITGFVAFFVMLTAAATLWAGDKPAGTVEEVAESLRPLAGNFAAELFAVGLLNAALMAMAVLPLTTAYAICEAFGWERSVNKGPREAPVFFGLFGGLLAFGAAAVLIPGVPLLLLIMLPNVVGGLLLPIILVLALKLVNDRRIMGRRANSRRQNLLGGAAAAMMMALTALYIAVIVLTGFGVAG